VVALLLVGGIWLYRTTTLTGGTFAVVQPDPPRADKTKAAADAEARRKAEEAEGRRLAAAAVSQSTPAATNRLFEIRRDMEAKSYDTSYISRGLARDLAPALVRSMDECEQKCTQSATCKAFTLQKTPLEPGAPERQCFLYSDVELVPNSNFDSGVRK